MESKKFTTISGVLMLPLSIGKCAHILHEGGYTRTAKVVAVHSMERGNIRFETVDTHYRLLSDPMSQAADCRPVMGMAA